MQSLQFRDLTLGRSWAELDPTIGGRDAYATYWETGSVGSAVAYFEIDPGQHIGRHIHSSEETILVLAGSLVISVGDESVELNGPGLVVAPALIPHDARNVGTETAKCVGFFASSSVVSVYDTPLEPSGSRIQGTPVARGDLSAG